jgi:hypothetical protein
MNRVDFTNYICTLLGMMINAGERPIIDFVKRSDEEQNRLYRLGLSKCDGHTKISRHQRGKAMDIYWVDEMTGTLTEPRKGFEYWHEKWEHMGGQPMIEWDKHHFE